MVKKQKRPVADIVIGKEAKNLSTQPNQITDLHMAPTLYSERAMDELVWTLQPFYSAAKQRENRDKDGTQLLFNFNKDSAYLVTPEKANAIEHEGDFVATIRFRDLPGITPKHYSEVRQVLKDLVKTVAEVHTDDGVLTTNLIDIVEEYETREITDVKTGEKKTVKTNNLKRNEIKIRIRSEILRHNFFLTESGYTQFYFPATRHTKTATANRIYKWLSKWRGIKREQVEMISQEQPDGSTRQIGQIIFCADYTEVRSVCGLYNSKDGKVINGERIETNAARLAEKEGLQWSEMKPAEKEKFLTLALEKAKEKYAYFSEFAKRYLAQAKKELDDLAARKIADFSFDYRAIFADGRAKGKVPVQVEFTLYVFELGQELYEDKEAASKEITAKEIMQTELSITAVQANDFIRRLQPGDHDHLLVKLRFLVEKKNEQPKEKLQNWAVRCLNTFFQKELPAKRGFAAAEEVDGGIQNSKFKIQNEVNVQEPTSNSRLSVIGERLEQLSTFKAALLQAWCRHREDESGVVALVDSLQVASINTEEKVISLSSSKFSFTREFAVPHYWDPEEFDRLVATHFDGCVFR